MARPPLARLAATLRPARRSADVPDADHALLARFVQSRDEAAFRALLERHAGPVLTACRQVLADPADVDDAFQATFLVLLKKAKGVDACTPLGGWLFAVAHRVAVRCRADKARRSAREAEAARRNRTTAEAPDLSWKEAAAVLHAELNGLPDQYRLPLLLCCVQGLARDEAAEQLGTTVGAVRGQLERGRNLLERRLARRGVVLSAGLLAVLMGSSRSAGGPPVALIELAVRAAGGNASRAVAALTTGALPMTTTLKRILLPAVLALGLLGAGVGFTPRVPVANADDKKPTQDKMEKPKADAKAEPQPAEVSERTITGTVFGQDGKPLAADLSVVWVEGKTDRLGRSGEDGRFKVTVPLKFNDHGGWLVLAAPGHGVDFHPNGMDHIKRSMTASADLTFRLPKERPIKGRVLDQQGKPVAGATVTLSSLSAFDSDASRAEHLKKWATELFLRGVPPDGDRGMWFPKGSERQKVTTDKDGRYELGGVGAGQLAMLELTGRGVADAEVVTLNADGFDPEPTNKVVRTHEHKEFGGKWFLAGPDPTSVLESEKVIRGTVTDHEGKPRAGVNVVFSRTSTRDLNSDHNQATTDRDGRYEIRGARKHKGYMVEVDADPAAGLLPCQGFADDTVGYEPITIDIKQAKGVVVSGTVTNKATGQPLPARVYARVFVNNPFVDKYPPFMHAASIATSHTQTDKDGKYRVVIIPGPVILMAGPLKGDGRQFKPAVPDPDFAAHFHPTEGALTFDTYGGGESFVQGCWCKVLAAKPTDTEVKQDIQLAPATKTAVRVVDADDKPVTGVHATGVEVLEFARPTEFPDTDALTVFNLDAKKPRLVAAVHPKRKLVGTLTLAADAKDPVVKLGTGGTVTGRAVDAKGKPLPGLAVHVLYAHRPVAEAHGVLYPNFPETDANGEFRVDTVCPGEEFRVMFFRNGNRVGPEYDQLSKHSVGQHGDALKLGDVKIETGKDE